MRRATYKLDNQSPDLNLAISTFGVTDKLQPYLMINFNRWRGEMGLGPIGLEDVDEQYSKIEGHEKGYLLELKGGFKKSGMGGGMGGGRGPFSNMGAGFGSAPSAKSGSASSSSNAKNQKSSERKSEGITAKAPEDWKTAKATMFSRLSYSMEKGDGKITVTVSPLTTNNNWIENVGRWLGAVKAERIEEKQINEQTKEIVAGSHKGKLIKIVSKDGATTLIGAVIVTENFAWFYKLQGDSALANEQSENYQKFIESSIFE